MTDVEIVHDDGANTYMVRGGAAQDLRNGVALRRLWEALPDELVQRAERRYEALVIAIGCDTDSEPPCFYVQVETTNTYEGNSIHASGAAATIAEAADKCREAL